MTHPSGQADSLRVERVRGPELRRGLFNLTVSVIPAGVFFSALLFGCVPLLCAAIGMDDRSFGVIAALPAAVVLLQIPASFWLARGVRRRTVVVATGFLHRLLWVPIGIIPYWMGPSAEAVVLVMVLIALSHATGSICGYFWQSWMADLVPPRKRGLYFGKRFQLFHVVMLAMSAVIALSLPTTDAAEQAEPLLRALAIIFTVCSLIGAVEMLLFFRVPEAPRPAPAHPPALRTLFTPLTDRNFRIAVGFAMLVTAGTAVLGPFLWQHCIRWLHLEAWKITLMLQAAPIVAVIVMGPIWGKSLDRFGRKATLLVSVLGGTLVTFLWFLVHPSLWWLGILCGLLGQLFWSGVDLAILQMMFGFAQTRKTHKGASERSSTGSGGVYLTAFNVLNASAAVTAGLLAGQIAFQLHEAQWIHDLDASLGVVQFSPYMVLLLGSVALRLLALAIFLPRIPRDGRQATNRIVLTMATLVYAGMTQWLEKAFRVVSPRPRTGRDQS
ncbi:MAG: MFS transporter [Phycisphaeraceae bacterium]|nr:MFS transporter [Phycisphaeraceae bacterium]